MSRASTDARVLGLLAVADLAVHLAVSGRYGYWIDELYFVVCGERLAWGYVDHPPLVAVAAFVPRLFSESLTALRFLPALAGAALVFLAGWLARYLGGGRAAQVLAAAAILASPVHQLFSSVLTMNSFEALFWLGSAWVVLAMARGGPRSLWLGFGVLAGIGLLNKHSMAFFAASVLAGLVLTPQRSLLRGPWIWLGGAAALLIASPHLLWQAEHGWPTLELLDNARRYQHQPVTPLEFVWGQVQLVNPLSLPVWLAGLGYLLLDRRGAAARFLGWAFVLLFGAFLFTQAKSYYLGPFYSILFAAGAVEIEALGVRAARGWIPWAAVGLVALGGAITLPYVVPVLPLEAIPVYTSLLPITEVRAEKRMMAEVPQIFADMLGWDELTSEVTRVYRALPPEEQRTAVIWGSGYGDAAAVDLFGRRQGLPAAVSGHQNYFLWGARAEPGATWIAVGFGGERLAPWFERLELAGEVRCELCMPDRRLQRIHLGRGLRAPLATFWPLVKCWTCDRPAFVDAVP